jgi:hypothetical protein
MQLPGGDEGADAGGQEVDGVVINVAVRWSKHHFVREDNHAHSKHTTAMAAANETSFILVAAPLASMIRSGTARSTTTSTTNGIALGRAKFSVQPIHFRRLGTITRGSALQ